MTIHSSSTTLEVPLARDTVSADRTFFNHPRGLSTLFFAEMWERFSYYGMRGFLILYMTAAPTAGGMGLDVAAAGAIYGTYTSLVYLMNLPGGWIADRLIGQRRAVLYGGILIALGHYSLAVPTIAAFYLGLALIVLGTGLLKPNVSVIVGQLYAPNDVRRDGAPGRDQPLADRGERRRRQLCSLLLALGHDYRCFSMRPTRVRIRLSPRSEGRSGQRARSDPRGGPERVQRR